MTLNQQGQPQAQDLEDASASLAEEAYGGVAKAAYGGIAAQTGGAMLPVVIPPVVSAPPHPVVIPPREMRHVGVIKKFNQERRFGFIDCQDLWAKFGRDVFLSDLQLGSFSVGSQVSFTLTLNQQGHPQAQDLQDASATAPLKTHNQGWSSPDTSILPAKRARTEFEQPAVQLQWTNDPIAVADRHIGVIKKFWAENKYGFIECPELQAHFGVDVFLSDKQIGQYQNGSTVSFRYEVKNGKPQAYDLADPS